MKKIFQTSALVALALSATPLARAWTYNDGDALLIFRANGFNDVEFDIGNISQFTNLANGVTITVPNWNLNLVTTTFGSDLTGVSVIVAATKSSSDPNRSAWLTSKDTGATVKDVTPSAWQFDLYGTINGIGTKPVLNSVTPALTNAYSIDPSSLITRPSSYDYIVSGQNVALIPQFGGHAAVNVEGVAPASFGFWQISPSSVLTKPASKYVGTFAITASGVLTFTAGPISVATPSTIISITRAASLNTVTFTTTFGGNYSLAYTNKLGGPVATWPIVSGSVSGDGSNKSLNHSTTDSGGFYTVVRTP